MSRRQTPLYLVAIVMGAAASGIFFSTINNFLFEVYHIDAEGRGLLEFFRELPGVLTILFLAAVAIVREKYIMVAAALLIAAAFLGLGTIPSRYAAAVLLIFLWSIGAHLNLVLIQSYGVALAPAQKRGKLFGAVGGMRGVGYILGTGTVWIGMGYAHFGFSRVFQAAALFTAIAAGCFALLHQQGHTARRRRRLVFKRRYGLFYTLAVLFGVRKQIFLVFAPWVLVRLFGLETSQIALLLFVTAAVGIVGKPLLGLAIDRFGERRVLAADALVLIVICAGYGLAPHLFARAIALPLLFVFYAIDDLLFSLRSAHTTYLSKIVHSENELTTTISMSYAIEHVVSMTGPIVAGIIWVTYGFSWVFAISAGVALLMLSAALRIPPKRLLDRIHGQPGAAPPYEPGVANSRR